MKELVVGIDGSPDSRRALRWAAALAERAGVHLRAVEAWSYPSMTVVPGWRQLVSPDEMDDRTTEDIRTVVESENGARALEWAGSIGELTGTAVVAVYAWQATSSEVKPKLHQRLRAEAASTVDQWIADGGHRAGSLEVEGDPRTKLVELAGRMDAKLVVVGRRGTSKLRGLRTGGVSSYLVSNSPTTVA